MLKRGLRDSAVLESTCSERASTVSNKHHMIGFFWLIFLAVAHNFYQTCMSLYVVSVFRANVANTFMEIIWGLGLLFFYSEWMLLLLGDWVIDSSGLLLDLQWKPIGSAYKTKQTNKQTKTLEWSQFGVTASYGRHFFIQDRPCPCGVPALQVDLWFILTPRK